MPDLPIRGRAKALADLDLHLGFPGRRVLTLTGLPGVGKSRLARELLEQRRQGPSRAVVVQADQVYEPGLLERRIRSAAGIPATAEPGRAGVSDQDVSPTLVLVDDAHRAAETGETLRALIRTRPDLRLLVTSRSPLYIPDEVVFRVDPFPAPDPDLPARELAGHPAVQMFLDVASATGTSADTGRGALNAVARICALVGGLPLAIELAAARSAAFSPTSLLDLLSEQPHRTVLGGRRPGRPDDDHNLFDAIAWTESLLSPQQRSLLRRLAAFRSPVPVEAIASVTGVGNVIEGLSALVDMHLVQADHSDGATRFSLHPLVREHATERLEQEAPEEVEALHTAHIAWAMTFTTPLAAAKTGTQFLRGAEQLRPIGPDLRLALHRALDRGDARSAVHLGLGLAPYWFSRGAPPGHTDLLARIRSLPEIGEIPPGQRALLAGWHGLLRAETAGTAEEVEATLADLLDTVALARTTSPEVLLAVLGLTVRASRFAEDREAILPLCEEGRGLARSLGWKATLVRFEIWSGMLAHQAHDLQAARQWGLSAYQLAQGLDDTSVFLTASGFLRSVPGAAGLVPDLPSFDDLLSLARRTGNRHAQAWIQPLAAHHATDEGDLPRAASYAAEVIALGRAAEAWGWCGAPLMSLARIAALREDFQQAARFHGMVSLHLPVLRPGIAPWTLQQYEDAVHTARLQSGAAFDTAYLEAAGLTHRAAAEEALSYADSVTRARTHRVGDAAGSSEATVSGTATAQRDEGAVPLLTAREQEVLTLLVAGGTNKEISATLGISPKTVMHHTSNIYRKLEVRGRAQAVAWHLRTVQRRRTGDGSPR